MSSVNKTAIKRNPILIFVAAVALVLVCAIPLARSAFARNTYRITDGDRVLIHITRATDPVAVLYEAGLPLGESDTYVQGRSAGVSEITVQRLQTVTVDYCGEMIQTQTYGETVSTLLNRIGVVLGGDTTVSLPLSANTYDGMVVTVASVVQTTEQYTASIPYATVYCTDPSLPAGTTMVLTQGRDGQMRCTAMISCVNGVETERTVLSEQMMQPPVDEVIAIGAG